MKINKNQIKTISKKNSSCLYLLIKEMKVNKTLLYKMSKYKMIEIIKLQMKNFKNHWEIILVMINKLKYYQNHKITIEKVL